MPSDRHDRRHQADRSSPVSELFHLALGDSATGSLRLACRSQGLPGTALGIPDDLSHGPLDDGRARVDYMRACYRGYDGWTFDTTDAFTSWGKVIERIDREKPEAIVIWSGDNVSETTFLAMACSQLGQRQEPVLQVAIPGSDTPPYVAFHRPADLGDFYSGRRELAESELLALTADFQRIRRETGLLRRLEKGRVIGVPADRYDRLLLESCPIHWTPAPRVVGAAMARCDRRNLMSDLFFSHRLQFLIGAGVIEADGIRYRLREYGIRLVPS